MIVSLETPPHDPAIIRNDVSMIVSDDRGVYFSLLRLTSCTIRMDYDVNVFQSAFAIRKRVGRSRRNYREVRKHLAVC